MSSETIDPYVIELPSKEETTLKVKCKGKVIELDLFDFTLLKQGCYSQMNQLGHKDRDVFSDLLIRSLKDKYELDIGKQAFLALLVKINEMEDAIKKKYNQNSESVDSTKQPQDSEIAPVELQDLTVNS